MVAIGIVGSGPEELLPDLSLYQPHIDIWIGADRGAWFLYSHGFQMDYAVGDFDSLETEKRKILTKQVPHMDVYPIEKDKTDIEIALLKALQLQPNKIYLFGVTGGRLDHELINIQLLHTIIAKNIKGYIVDIHNKMSLTKPGKHIVNHDENYPYISFIPFTSLVKGLTLQGFYYPLENETIEWGSTLCISNKLVANSGTSSYKEGILLCIKSRDARSHPIPL